MEVALARHRKKERRFGPSPANNYTSGYGKRGRFSNWFSFGRRRHDTTGDGEDPNALPTHATPNDVRDSYGTEQTRVGTSNGDPLTATGAYEKYTQPGYGQQSGAAAHYPPANYQYDDGVYNSRT